MQFKHKLSYIANRGMLVTVVLLGMASINLVQGNPWATKANMPTPRGLLSTSVVDGIIYAIGGGSGPYSNFSIVEAYDPKTDTWTTKANMPTPRANVSTCVVDGIIYAIGGGWAPALSTVEAYDPVTDTWTTKTPMLTPRTALSTSAVNGIIYAIGGAPDAQTGLAIVEAYDPVTDTWTTKTPMPTRRTVSSTSVVDGIIYAIGGGVTFAPGASTLRTVEAYDPAANTWTKKADMSTSRAVSASVIDGMIYAIGGVAYGGGPGLSTVEAYDPITNTWTKKTNMPTPRKFLSCSAMDGKIYAVGGVNSAGQALVTVEEYDPSFESSTGVEERFGSTDKPLGYALSQNYPNPFNPATTIEFALPRSAYVTLKIYNQRGEEAATLVAEKRSAGIHRLHWDAGEFNGGVYLYRLRTEDFIQCKKLILLR
jgi:N-acetylneuraminic acid mutarotase